MPLTRVMILFLIAIVGLVATSWTIRETAQLTQYRNTDMLADRVRRVLSEPAVDTLFVGTSRTEVMLDPDRFDAAMKAGGHPTHSYVAGMAAMSVPEIEPLLRAVLNARPCCLKTVILEPDFASMTPATMWATARSIHFSSLTNTLSMLRYIDSLGQNPPDGTKETFKKNIIYWAGVRLLNIGLVHYLLDSSFTNWSLPKMMHWPAPGSEDTELGVLMEPEVGHGEAEVHTRVQA